MADSGANWQTAYAELLRYVADNPDIKITSETTAIPAEARAEFYGLFAAVKAAFLHQSQPSRLAEAQALSLNYHAIKAELVAETALKDVKLAAGLARFLDDPLVDLERVLTDPLFALIKGDIDQNAFEQTALSVSTDLIEHSLPRGYQQWVALSLLAQLHPDEAFSVPTAYLDGLAGSSERLEGADWRERVPGPQPTNSFVSERAPQVTFTVPDIIVRAAGSGRFVALRTEPQEAAWIALAPSTRREWLSTRALRQASVQIISSPHILIYIDQSPEDLVMVADYERLARPDMIVKCLARGDGQAERESTLLDHRLLRPKLGTFVVCREPVSVPNPGSENETNGIRVLAVGFEKTNLMPLIELISRGEISSPVG